MPTTQTTPTDPGDTLMKVVLVANAAPPKFFGFVDVVLSQTGITRADFPEGWNIGRNLALYTSPSVEYWSEDEIKQKLTKHASDEWGPWVLDETQYNIRIDKISNRMFGNCVIAYFRRHDFLASINQKKQSGPQTLANNFAVEAYLRKIIPTVDKATEVEIEALRKEAGSKGQSVSEAALSDFLFFLGGVLYGLQRDSRIREWTVEAKAPTISLIGNSGDVDNPPSWIFAIGTDGRVYSATNTGRSLII